MKRTYKIAVTGGIACGKSVVRTILDELGIPTIDADEIVHDILQNDEDSINKIKEEFGLEVLKEDGGVDRKKLAQEVFADNSKLKSLENIVHPIVYYRLNMFINSSEKEVVAAVIPLLFETNKQHMFDAVWLVSSTEEEQIKRLKLRDNMDESEAKQRIAVQMPQSLKSTLSDVIINNSSTFEALKDQVEKELFKIRNLT